MFIGLWATKQTQKLFNARKTTQVLQMSQGAIRIKLERTKISSTPKALQQKGNYLEKIPNWTCEPSMLLREGKNEVTQEPSLFLDNITWGKFFPDCQARIPKIRSHKTVPLQCCSYYHFTNNQFWDGVHIITLICAVEKYHFWAALCYSLPVLISRLWEWPCQFPAAFIGILPSFKQPFSILLSYLPETGWGSGKNNWVITVSHKSGTSSSSMNIRHEETATVQEFCPDSSETVLLISSKNKSHQIAASRSQSYCSSLYSNFTRVNWPNLKPWALIQWGNTEISGWNDWLTHCIKRKTFDNTSKLENKNFHGKVKIKWWPFISPSSQLLWEMTYLSQIL